MRPFVVHHHGFKCAGSTFVSLLHRNWPEQVLHFEHRQPDRRITCEQLAPFLQTDEHVAVTSHLLSIPARGSELAHVHFGLVRDPIERLISAYHFVPEERRDGGFLPFVASLHHFGNEYHVRQLSTQPTLQDATGGWAADLEQVRLRDPHVLIGLVERFDDTMFLLERRLAAVGCMIDLSVGKRHNVGKRSAPTAPPDELDAATLATLRAANDLDYQLIARVQTALDEELSRVDPDGAGRRLYAARCAVRADFAEPYLGHLTSRWTYLED